MERDMVRERESEYWCKFDYIGPPVETDVVENWIQFLVTNGIQRVLCLLNSEELNFYSYSLLDLYKKHFKQVSHVPLGVTGNSGLLKPILDALQDAENANEKIVVHCSTVRMHVAIISLL